MDKIYNPKVSIIIPVYNGSNYLADAIDSALAQTYSNIEVVVVNDGSIDEGATEKIALSYGNKIKYIYKKNGGVSSALNTGIKNMSGSFFSWLSHDDLYLPDKIAKQVSLIKNDNTIVLCSGGLINAEKHPIKHYTKRIKKSEISGIKLFDYFLSNYALNGLGFLIPKKVFDECGYFDENMKYLQDLDMWLRICASDFKFTLQKDLLVLTRIHINQQTNTLSNQFLIDRDLMVKKNFNMLANSTHDKRYEIIKRYYLLSVKAHNKKYIKLLKGFLKKNNELKGVFLKSTYYYFYGSLVNLYRKIRFKIMVKNKVRD